MPCKFKLVRELAARGSGGAHSVLQANQAEPNGGERGDVYSKVFRRPGGARERGALRNRGADQQAAMPESCDCFLRQRPYYILCLPKLPDLPFTRPPALRALHSHCLFEYYYIYTTRTDGIEEGNSNSLGFGLLWLEARSCYKREQP